jgi:hypothetical protein
MNIIGTFIKGLACRERDFFAAFHLHHNGSFQHVNECMRIVPMNRIRSAGRIYDSDHHTFLAGKIRQILRYDWCDLSLLRNQGPVTRNASTNMNREIFIMVRLHAAYAPVFRVCLATSMSQPSKSLAELRAVVRNQRLLAHRMP